VDPYVHRALAIDHTHEPQWQRLHAPTWPWLCQRPMAAEPALLDGGHARAWPKVNWTSAHKGAHQSRLKLRETTFSVSFHLKISVRAYFKEFYM